MAGSVARSRQSSVAQLSVGSGPDRGLTRRTTLSEIKHGDIDGRQRQFIKRQSTSNLLHVSGERPTRKGRGRLPRGSSFLSDQATSYCSSVAEESDMSGDKYSSRFSDRAEALKFWRKAVVKVQIVNAWVNLLKRGDEFEKKLKTITDLALEAEKNVHGSWEAQGVSFDRNQFKASREVKLSQAVIRILQLPKAKRTPTMIQKVLYSLQTIVSFAEYPLHMQEKLAGVVWYQKIPERKVILRQGHKPENFYFIVSGKALVKVTHVNHDTGELFMTTVATLARGASFGEIALIHDIKRTATIQSATDMQLLMVTREDFLRIFLERSLSGEEPEYIKFCKKLDFLKYWPCDKLLDSTGQTLFHFFRPGAVVVADSNSSRWIYIVRSGTCQVLKKLKAVKPNYKRTKEKKVFKSLEKEFDSKTDSGLKKNVETFPPPISLAEARLKAEARRIFKTQAKPKVSITVVGDANKPAITVEDSDAVESSKTDKPAEEDRALTPSGRPKYNPLEVFRSRAKSIAIVKRLQKQAEENFFPQFVQMELLGPKDVFGLNNIVFPDDIQGQPNMTSVSLVSRGAELIMLDKDFFIKHANEATRRKVKSITRPYPDQSVIQDNLQVHVNWSSYANGVTNDCVTLKRELNRLGTWQ